MTDKPIKGAKCASLEKVSFTVNGKPYEFEVEPQETLVEVLREKLRMMRTKEGCGVGECGSCTVIMNGKAVASCLVLAVDADGAEIVVQPGERRAMGAFPFYSGAHNSSESQSWCVLLSDVALEVDRNFHFGLLSTVSILPAAIL